MSAATQMVAVKNFERLIAIVLMTEAAGLRSSSSHASRPQKSVGHDL